MEEKEKLPEADQTLRLAAEEIAREKEVLLPEKMAAMLPEEASETLHELLVHRIELEMQNEELRRTQAALAVAKARYFDLYDLAPVGYLVISEKGLIIETNLTAATQLGVSRGGLIQQPISRFILKEDQGDYYLHRKQLLETGEQQSCEIRMVKKGGKSYWAQLEISAVQDADGISTCHVVLSDITVRKQAEENLQSKVLAQNLIVTISAELINSTMDNFALKISHIIKTIGEFFGVDRCYIFRITPSGGNLILSDEWCQEGIFSLDSLLPEIPMKQFPWLAKKIREEESLCIPDTEQLPDEARAEKEIFRALKIHSLIQIPMRQNRLLSGIIGCDSVSRPRVCIDDQRGFLQVIAHIISDALAKNEMEKALLVAKEKAENESKLKTEYFANFSHEFRTPLNVILSAIQLFEMYMSKEENQVSEKTAKHLKSMKQNTLRLTRLVNNLIDVTRIDSGFYQPEIHNYNIISIMEKIVAAISTYAEPKNIDIVFETELEEKIIKCDVEMIERIMLNLVSNAIKFSRDDCQIKITITMAPAAVMISVKDSGVGIDKDKQKMIFERYKQAPNNLYQKDEGSGIGLDLTKALVEMQGGIIYLKSETGKGSEFIIELPDLIIGEEGNRTSTYSDEEDEQRLMAKMNVEFADIYR